MAKFDVEKDHEELNAKESEKLLDLVNQVEKDKQVQKPTLREIAFDYMQFLDFAEDPDTDPEAIKDTFEGLDGALEDKADAYARVLQELGGKSIILDAEIERLQKKKKTIENNITYMKKILQETMELTGKEKFKTDYFAFSIATNPPQVLMNENVSLDDLPLEYLKPQPPKIDKEAIKKDLKAGKDLSFATLIQTRSLRIK